MNLLYNEPFYLNNYILGLKMLGCIQKSLSWLSACCSVQLVSRTTPKNKVKKSCCRLRWLKELAADLMGSALDWFQKPVNQQFRKSVSNDVAYLLESRALFTETYYAPVKTK